MKPPATALIRGARGAEDLWLQDSLLLYCPLSKPLLMAQNPSTAHLAAKVKRESLWHGFPCLFMDARLVLKTAVMGAHLRPTRRPFLSEDISTMFRWMETPRWEFT